MLRRPCVSAVDMFAGASSAIVAVSPRRGISTEQKDITRSGQPHPPAVPHNEPILPMDFNPHIEWFEYPKEIFDPKYPYTREESIRMTEESWESTMDEMASRYGMRLNMTTKTNVLDGVEYNGILLMVHPLGLLPCDGDGTRLATLPTNSAEPAQCSDARGG
ncbi:hypothetical protein C3747_190g49 [Trypanosoma cruzi]|uniref:Uncharacterized protein n=1 Tax=Trypanosoma cruzi TaxID=5693 RepID=A0A2V2W398_TRYCR|nr:hypothetical protein C3747_190g49 [Trypanosoma cruzi]